MKKNNIFKGLLECPFRKGYVEFEFQNGDTVADLLSQVENTWGQNNEELLSQAEGLSEVSTSGWVIGCEDADSAYRILKLTDLIPITTVPPNEIIEPDKMVYGYDTGERSNGMLDIFSYRMVKYGTPFLYHRIGKESNYQTDPENFDKHIRITIKRTYKIPEKNFDIRLIALAAIPGG